MKEANGTFSVKATPFPARVGPPLCRVGVKYEDDSVSGITEDRAYRIGEKELKLSQLRTIRLGAKPEVQLRDGQRLEGKLSGLDAFPLQVGKQALRLDLTAASEVNVEPREDATVLYCTVLARENGKEVASSSTPLYIAGVSQPNSPADWTKDLKKSVIPDGPVVGTLKGAEFKAERVQLQATVLTIQSGMDTIHIFLTLKPGKDVYEWKSDDPQAKTRPAIHYHISSRQPPDGGVATTGYDMRLEFGKEKDGKIPCKLYVCLNDDHKSCIAGTFTIPAD
jgi:hypothetical protein